MVFPRWFRLGEEEDDPNEVIRYFWETDIANHQFGEFSYAVLQGRRFIEDYSQVEVAEGSVFCGLYDGHGGPLASQYVGRHLYDRFRGHVQRSGMISGYTILNAIVDTENGFLDTVRANFNVDQSIAAMGSCCLVGVLEGRTLHYANLGDSRAVLGYVDYWGNIRAKQLTEDHDVNIRRIRKEYKASHPGSDGLLLKQDGIWRINGMHRVTRCIGDGTFKRDNLAIQSELLDIPRQTRRPLLSAIPSVQAREMRPADRFVIFATNGLWEVLTNGEASQLVHEGPRQGAARRLVKKALRRRAKKAGVGYDVLRVMEDMEIRPKHLDDISVVVLFVDHHLLENPRHMPALSVTGYGAESGSKSDISNNWSDGSSSDTDELSDGSSSDTDELSDGSSSDSFEIPKDYEINIDWKFAITHRDQRGAPDCWALGACGLYESVRCALGLDNVRKLFSPQHLINNCTPITVKGKEGYNMSIALEYIFREGIPEEHVCPYLRRRSVCRHGPRVPLYKCDGIVRISEIPPSPIVENQVLDVLKGHTLGAALHTNNYLSTLDKAVYHGDEDELDKGYVQLDHAIVVIGYGSDNDGYFWLFSNTWNENWGDEGVGKVRFNSDNRCNRRIIGRFKYPIFFNDTP